MILMALCFLMVHHFKIHDELSRKFLKSFGNTYIIDLPAPLIFSPPSPK